MVRAVMQFDFFVPPLGNFIGLLLT